MARSSFGLSVMNTARAGGARPPGLRPAALRPARGPRRPLPSAHAAGRGPDDERGPPSPRWAARLAAGLTCLAWTPSDPAPPLYGAVAAAGPRAARAVPQPPGLVPFPGGPGLPSPLTSARDPPAPTRPSAAPVRCPLLQRPGTPPSPSALRPAGRARAGAPSFAPARGSLPPPLRPRRGCRTAVPSYVSPAPRRSPSYAGMRSDPRRRQQLFPDFFKNFSPPARPWRLRR